MTAILERFTAAPGSCLRALGRLATITCPETYGPNGQTAADSRFKLRYAYDAIGNLTRVSNARNPADVYWQSATRDFLGRTTRATLGNGLITTTAWDRVNGFIKTMGVNTVSGTSLRGSKYIWSAAGNLNKRIDTTSGASDIFHYDALDRLTDVYAGSDQDPPVASARYHDDGRIKSRSGNAGITGNTLGSYSYDETKPFELTAASGPPSPLQDAFAHDALGNAVQWRGLDAQWDATNRLTRIDNPASGDWLTLVYGAGGERLVKEQSVNGDYRKLERWGALTERLTQTLPSGSLAITWRHRIVIEGEVKTVVVRSGDGDKAYYLHRDHLGSVTAMSDNLGTLVAERTYSAWGEVKTYSTGTEATFLAVTDASYTGQEQLAFGLLHYNGRVYDPIVGQFLSADPLIASPFNPQNANRRSYVLNNPLKYVDPSGFIDEAPKYLPQMIITGSVPCPKCIRSMWEFLGRIVANAAGGGVGTYSGSANGISWTLYLRDKPSIDTTRLEESLVAELERNRQHLNYMQAFRSFQEMVWAFMRMTPMGSVHQLRPVATVIWKRSTEAGDSAARYYAGRIASGNAHAGHYVGLALASLWTPETAPMTASVLSVGIGGGIHAGRPFWRYIGPKSAANSPWLTRGLGWAAPYGNNFVRARNALQLPFLPNAVVRVKVPWWQPVIGPRGVYGNFRWGHGGGIEYARGWWWP